MAASSRSSAGQTSAHNAWLPRASSAVYSFAVIRLGLENSTSETMAVVVPVLRLWLLLLNLYGTFKAVKPPPVSLRNTRNGQGPSGRALQLRKREMKSSLAVWVVWVRDARIEHEVSA
jgi:hypothetical protein